MEFILFFIICGMSFSQGIKAQTSETQTMVFNKRKLPLKDVKEYNQYVARLLYGFGIVGGITAAAMMLTSGWISFACSLLIIVEALIVVKVYSKNEIRFLRQN